MSKAYYYVKNFSWPELKNLLCYGTKHPEALSSQQRLTRIYRATLRRYQALKLEGYRTDFDEYNQTLFQARQDFNKMQKLDLNSIELQKYFEKYEAIQEELYDPCMILNDCRPYCNTSDRYYVFGDNQLNYDPFGYYKPRLMSDNRPNANLPYYEDYPMNDSHWNLWELFPEDFDDADYVTNENKIE